MRITQIVGVATIVALATFGLVTLILVVRDQLWTGPKALDKHAERKKAVPAE